MRPTLTNLLPLPQTFVSSSPALPTTSMSTNNLVININTEAAAAVQPTKTNVNIKSDMEGNTATVDGEEEEEDDEEEEIDDDESEAL